MVVTDLLHLFLELKDLVERFNVMALGEYTFEGNMNLTPFFEVMYNERETFSDGGGFQLFPFIDRDNPFSPCNPNGAGVDCGLAFDQFWANPNNIAGFIDAQGFDPLALGWGDGIPDSGLVSTRLVTSVRGDRTQTTSTLEQTRFVTGVRGDIPQIPLGGKSDWQFEAVAYQTESKGFASRPGIREDRIQLASTTIEDPTSPTGFRCDADGERDANGDLDYETTDTCFPVNFFAPSLYAGVIGDFATQAERDFLFDVRTFDTTYEQTVGSIFFNGSLFDLPAGTVQGGIGYQYRDDKIRSNPDEIAAEGLFFGFFADRGGQGDKYTKELFAEIELPLLADKPLAKELTLNLSGNQTDDEVHDDDTTFAAKLAYRPFDSLMLRATTGTSYQAPNLRQTFLAGQSGFGNANDPCAVPFDAWNQFAPEGQEYLPNQDTRDPLVLANCRATGVDPTRLFLGGFNTYSVEAESGGAGDLRSETSENLTAGFSFEQPFWDEFGLTVGMSYYKVVINDTIVEPGIGEIVNGCYLDPQGDNPFCNRIFRADDGNGNFTIDLVDTSFINRDEESVRGLDLVPDPVTNVPTTQTTNVEGRFGFPNWSGNLRLRGGYNNYNVTWSTRYIGDVRQFDDTNPFSDVVGSSDTCLGPSQGDVLCRDVNFAGSEIVHSLAVFYRGDQWTIGAGNK